MRRFDLTGNHTERVGEKQKFSLQQQEKLSFCDKTMRNVLMNLWLRKGVATLTIAVVGGAAVGLMDHRTCRDDTCCTDAA